MSCTCSSCCLSDTAWWSLVLVFLDKHSFISVTTFALYRCFQTVPNMRVWFMEAWFGMNLLPREPANTSARSTLKLWIITLLICQRQHLWTPQEEPVARSCFAPVALTRLTYTSGGGALAPLWTSAAFTAQFMWRKQNLNRGQKVGRTTPRCRERQELNPAVVAWLNTNSPFQHHSAEPLKLDKW